MMYIYTYLFYTSLCGTLVFSAAPAASARLLHHTSVNNSPHTSPSHTHASHLSSLTHLTPLTFTPPSFSRSHSHLTILTPVALLVRVVAGGRVCARGSRAPWLVALLSVCSSRGAGVRARVAAAGTFWDVLLL